MTRLDVGDIAPDFQLPSDAGKPLKLSDFKGRTTVVYFYPKDDTPGCTIEARDFSAAAKRFAKAGVTVLGISRDTVAKHCKFRDKYSLAIPLLSDEDLAVHNAYGVWGEKLMYGKKVEGVIRSTFVVGPDGRITRASYGVKVPGHVDGLLAELAPT